MAFFNSHPTVTQPPPVDSLSPDLRFHLWQRQSRRRRRDNLLGLIAVSPALVVLLLPPVNRWVEHRLPWTARMTPGLVPADLFRSRDALGACAIGHAEGTLTADCQPTPLHRRHTDPGNFKANSGWCSDQGRAGGNPALADQQCLDRARNRMPVHLEDLQAAHLPEHDLAALVNTADLYNQAAPVHSRRFPRLLVQERLQRGNSLEALAHARTRSFGEDARDATGLLGICRREGRPVSDYDCVLADQRRRVEAIDRVLNTHLDAQASFPSRVPSATGVYFPIPGQTLATATLTSGYGQRLFQGQPDFHGGLDFAGAVGTPLVATEAGTVTATPRVSDPHNDGCGNGVIYTVADGSTLTYCHLATVTVRPGDRLRGGQPVGTLGNTGRSTGPHLHIARSTPAGVSQDPTDYLRSAQSP